MKKLNYFAALLFSVLICSNLAQANDSVSDTIKRNTQEIYDSSSAAFGTTVGGKNSANLVLQHVSKSPHFKEVKDWLDNLLRANNYGQVRIVLTPGDSECKVIVNQTGIQCTGTETINLFFAPQKGMDDWSGWVKSPYSLTSKVSGPAYKTISGVGVGMKEDEMQSSFSTDLIMLAGKPFDYAEGDDRSGPMVPSNHNWLPDSILSTKSGYTGNSKGFYSRAGMLRVAFEDAIAAFNLQSYTYVISWVN